MKRYIHATTESGWLSNIDKIDIVCIVDDAREQGLNRLPIKASSDYEEDYDQFTIEELLELDDSVLRKIDSYYALDKLNDAWRAGGSSYKLSGKQKEKLSEYYKKRELSNVEPTDEEIQHMLNLIAECKHVAGPYERPGQPEKNFAKMHDLKMVQDDYMAIIKDIDLSEYIGALKSSETRRLGAVMYEFIHDPHGYELMYSGQVIDEDIEIYIKVLPDYENDYTVAIVSFHDPLD